MQLGIPATNTNSRVRFWVAIDHLDKWAPYGSFSESLSLELLSLQIDPSIQHDLPQSLYLTHLLYIYPLLSRHTEMCMLNFYRQPRVAWSLRTVPHGCKHPREKLAPDVHGLPHAS